MGGCSDGGRCVVMGGCNVDPLGDVTSGMQFPHLRNPITTTQKKIQINRGNHQRKNVYSSISEFKTFIK